MRYGHESFLSGSACAHGNADPVARGLGGSSLFVHAAQAKPNIYSNNVWRSMESAATPSAAEVLEAAESFATGFGSDDMPSVHAKGS